MERRLRGRRRLGVGLLVGAAVVAGGLAAAWAGGLILHDTSTPASVKEALLRFRARDSSPRTLDGVYLYATRGGESVDALGGAHHRYPGTTTITVVRVSCGVELRWAALEERSTRWELCTTPLGIDLRVLDQSHRFFSRSDRTNYTCRNDVLEPARPGAARTRRFACHSGRDDQAGIARVLGREEISVGKTRVSVVHVLTTARVTGGDSGIETVGWWLAPSGLPIRIALVSRTSRPLFLGRVHYREDADLRLVSTIPLR